MTTLLEAHGVSKHFGGVFAVEGVDLTVEEGEIHCLIGPNGAGKSTLFKLIVGTYAPSAGSIAFRGADVTTAAPFKRVQQGISIKMQTPSVFKALPVRQNLHVALQHHAVRGDVEAEEDRLLSLLGLADDADSEAGALSHGQQQWLEIGWPSRSSHRCCSWTSRPPASPGRDVPHWRVGEQLNRNGMTMLVVEHDMAFVRQIATRVTVLHLGRVFANGGIDEIVGDPGVREIYLGTPHGSDS